MASHSLGYTCTKDPPSQTLLSRCQREDDCLEVVEGISFKEGTVWRKDETFNCAEEEVAKANSYIK